ncbi:MAG: ATP-binding cassette domain-containing protein [Lachnospiraceae bacterium]|nr:ATP-binding cassette domain-containing protein [Lachnospiraceae bacterium]
MTEINTSHYRQGGKPCLLYFGGKTLIELVNIVKEFKVTGRGEAVHAVNDVSLTVEDGDIFGIIGFSGAGKSTLVRCINLLGRPSSGKVIIDGRDMMSLSDKELREARKKIGMIFQHFNLMPSRTVEENVAFPLKGSGLTKDQIHEKVMKLLKLVEIDEKASVYPSQLSGGQKQRVAIARALANDPNILLCDEATSALDPQTTQSILQLIKRLNKELGLTVVVITHEMAVIKSICNKVAVMENGRVAESGDVFAIFTDPQQQITKNFIRTTSNVSKVYEFVENDAEVVRLKEGEVLAILHYRQPEDVSVPLISTASRRYEVNLNILFADVEIIDNKSIGDTVVILQGENDNVSEAIKYLERHNLRVEVVKDARISV